MSVLFTIAYPVLSAMQEGRKKFAWRVTKMSLIMSLPLSYSVIFYSKQIMQLFGQDYAVGASSLQILLLSMLPIVVMTGINTLVNAYGNYRQVLAIGVATNIPTAILYLIFIPIYDNSVGAAINYTFGSVIGFVVSIVIAKKIEMQIFWKDIAFILALPTGFGFLLSYFQVNYVIGISITLAISYLLLLRLHIITKIDIQDFLAIVPYSVANPILNLWNIVCVKLNKFRQ